MRSPDAEQDRIDRLVLSAGSNYGGCVVGLRFVLPPEVHPEGKGRTDATPGIYFDYQHPSGSPTAQLRYDEQLLTTGEALTWAARVDLMTSGRCRPGLDSIKTHVAFVEAWYAALGRKLDAAVQAAEGRSSTLREVRAAITGRVQP